MFFGKPDGRWSLHEGTARLMGQGALAVHLRTGAVNGAVHEKSKLSSKGASRQFAIAAIYSQTDVFRS